jgi:hypothetical protein
MGDAQADRVIDRLLAEQQRSKDIAATLQGKEVTTQVEKAEEAIAEKTPTPARRSDIMKIIDEKGEVSVNDLQKLIAKNIRRGL